MSSNNESLFAGTSGNGVFLSSDDGVNWNAVNSGIENSYIKTVNVINSDVYVGTNWGSYKTNNNGANWLEVYKDFSNFNKFNINSIVVSGSNIFAGTAGNGIFMSSDNGANWTAKNNGLTNNYITCLNNSNLGLLAGTSGGGIFLSTNSGANWVEFNAGLTYKNISTIAVKGDSVFAGSAAGVFQYNPKTFSWTPKNTGLYKAVTTLIFNNSLLLAGTKRGVYLSKDYGTNWTEMSDGLINKQILSLQNFGSNIFAGTEGAGIWKISVNQLTDVPIYENVSNVKLFPNPANNIVQIESGNLSNNNSELTIYDIRGNLVKLINIDSNFGKNTQFNVDDLNNGIYIVELKSAKNITFEKLIIQR